MVLLSVNTGSSSLKVSVFDDDQLDVPRTSLSIEGIGTSKSCLIPEGAYGSSETKFIPINSVEDAAELVKDWLVQTASVSVEEIVGIGHRVVHGGERFSRASLINDELVNYLTEITPLAPNHMPATLAMVQAFRHTYPNTPHIATFDTSFFHNIPEVAKTLPIPRNLQDKFSIHRYGFHGLSYQSLLDSFSKHEGSVAARGRVIMAHLGNGASVAACINGEPLDMSMGFTPVSGIMMSTRSGDIEPGVLTYLQKTQGFSTDDISKLLTYESGLLGVSGFSADMHELLMAEKSNKQAELAINLFCYKIKKTIGAYTTVLGGVDSIIFSGGIGERSAEIRNKICTGLEFLGIIIDEERNSEGARLISSDKSSVGVHIISAREDTSIIKQTAMIINEGA